MKLAFYYHIPTVVRDGNIYLPGYLGVFVDSLATVTEELYLVMHEARDFEKAEADYKLQSQNIKWVSLGLKTPAWHRSLFHGKVLGKITGALSSCDVLLLRSPSPLAPYFHKYLPHTRVVYLVVGDYAESVKQTETRSLREMVINLYLKHNDYLFRQRMKKTDVIVNSPALFNKYETNSKTIHQIKTTTLSQTDFFYRNDTCQDHTIQLLYTGRIDKLKGLFELVEATASLKQCSHNVMLNIVGWESIDGNPVEQQLKELAAKLGISSALVFHGKKKIGEQLNAMYRMADIYVIPSYEEGFPRTIWEAMANSLPVVATTVGAIPHYLKNETDAMLIAPKSTNEITEAIEKLIKDPSLRQKLISNGMKQAENNTLEYQARNLMDIITDLIKN
jgi:glycosyltransferase involved in cell wall biosynthesis